MASALNTAELELYIYTGTSGNYASTDLRYTIQKSKIGDDTNIIFEVGELVRDYITHNFNDDYPCDAVWVTASTTLLDENNITFTYGSPVVNTYLAVDGYGFYEESINPELSRNALITANTIYLPENTAGKVPIFAEGVGKIIIDSTTTQITDSGDSSQKIQYITIPANSSTIQVYDTDDATLKKTINVINVCEPKYTPFKITFINKFGAYQDLYMFKKTTESFNVTDEQYKKNNIQTSTVTYATNDGQKERHNTNATKSIQLNTGFINEDSNSTIEELFLSENVFIRQDSQTLAIIPKTKNLVFKTSLNDKLANYTIDFDFAFNKINNVR